MLNFGKNQLSLVAAGMVASCCRYVSNKQIPALTETLRLSTLPSMGMRVIWSQFSRVNRRIPCPFSP